MDEDCEVDCELEPPAVVDVDGRVVVEVVKGGVVVVVELVPALTAK